MIKIHIISIGKNKDSWLSEALDSYGKRLGGRAQIFYSFLKDDASLEKLLDKQRSVLCLDPTGWQPRSSPDFAKWFFVEAEKAGAELCFAIGGPEGFTPSLRQKGYPMLSLSKLTLTHQMVRLLLVEQIYRAFEIEKGSGYHK